MSDNSPASFREAIFEHLKKQKAEGTIKGNSHEFLKLQSSLEPVQKYSFDVKKIEEIRNRELRALQRRNQFQLEMMRKEEEAGKKNGLQWNYRERFSEIKRVNKEESQKNPIFNKSTIESYIDSAFQSQPDGRRGKVKLIPLEERERHKSQMDVIQSGLLQSESLNLLGPTTEQPSRQVVNKQGRVHFASTSVPSPRANESARPYNRREMFETIRNMSYGSFFQAHAPLHQVSQKFDLAGKKREVLQDVLDYLDLDLQKMKPSHSEAKAVRAKESISDRPSISNLSPKMFNPLLRMPNVYLIKELPTQKAIISPRIQKDLLRSESILTKKIKKYVFRSYK